MTGHTFDKRKRTFVVSTFMGFTEKGRCKSVVAIIICGWYYKNLSEFYDKIQRKGEQLYLGQEQMCRWSARTHKIILKDFLCSLSMLEAKFSFTERSIIEDMATTLIWISFNEMFCFFLVVPIDWKYIINYFFTTILHSQFILFVSGKKK